MAGEPDRIVRVLHALCEAFNDGDLARAADLFAYPVAFHLGDETITHRDRAALIDQFQTQLAEHRAIGVDAYRIEIGEVARSGGNATITAVWIHIGPDGGDGASTMLRYQLRQTGRDWRIASVDAGTTA